MNLYKRIGAIDQELLDQAMIMIKITQMRKPTVVNETETFIVGDTVTHLVFKHGVIKGVKTDEKINI